MWHNGLYATQLRFLTSLGCHEVQHLWVWAAHRGMSSNVSLWRQNISHRVPVRSCQSTETLSILTIRSTCIRKMLEVWDLMQSMGQASPAANSVIAPWFRHTGIEEVFTVVQSR